MKKLSKELKPKVFRVTITILVIVSLLVFCGLYFKKNVTPTVIDSAIAQVRAITTNAINLAATSVLSNSISYDDLFKIDKDKDGNVAVIQANSPKINAIARAIANLAQANLDSLGVQEISIAVGTFTGLALLIGFGPYVKIKITPIGTANCDFVSYFQSAGINQTLHKIYIDVYADVNIITPLDEPVIQVKAEILVCENLIIGKIPDVYFGNGSLGGLDLTP